MVRGSDASDSKSIKPSYRMEERQGVIAAVPEPPTESRPCASIRTAYTRSVGATIFTNTPILLKNTWLANPNALSDNRAAYFIELHASYMHGT